MVEKVVYTRGGTSGAAARVRFFTLACSGVPKAADRLAVGSEFVMLGELLI